MKFALFEFTEEKSCEVGETRWIVGEDSACFNNDEWLFNKEVMVRWPSCDSARILKRIAKSSVDIEDVKATTYSAKIVKFSDEYDNIRQYAKLYVETGSTTTPSRGRGQRVPKRNNRYEEESDNESCGTAASPQLVRRSKKSKKSTGSTTTSTDELEILKEKYNLGVDKDLESDEADDDSKEEILQLKRTLAEKNQEIKQLQNIMKNMKDLPLVQTIVQELQAHIQQFKSERACYVASPAPSSSSSTSGSWTSSTLPAVESDFETDVEFCSHVTLTKGQCSVLKGKKNAKDFIYAIMSMLWSRDIIATHSVSGRCSNAFKDKDAKPQLDADKVSSICEYTSQRFGITERDAKNIMRAKTSNVCKAVKLSNLKSSPKTSE